MTNPNSIPMAEVLQGANALVEQGVIRDYAIGGAVAAIVYMETFLTFDVDLFYHPATSGLDAGIPRIFENLQKRGWKVEQAHLVCAGFPVQFRAASGLTAEALDNAITTEFEGVRCKVFRAEHVIAIAAQVRRVKDRSRVAQMLDQAEIDHAYLQGILKRHGLIIPGYDF